MARIFTTAAGENAAKAWMHDLMVFTGITKDQRKANTNLFIRVGGTSLRSHAQKICDELINRDFTDITSSLNVLANYYFFPSLTIDCKHKSYSTDAAAKAIVYMAELLNLYWDDTVKTPYEIDEFKKTILGETVYKYGRVISAIPDKATKSTKASTASGTSSNNNIAPQNGYKSSGPQSGNVRDLKDLSGGVGTPGQKVLASSNLIYKIIADKVGKNTPNVFIKPLSASGEINGTNKIFISSGNGYTDCTCYFDDPNNAQAFLNTIIQNNRVPANIVNLRVAKMNADPNGYFLVGTEFGTVAVSAKTLNEALTEAATITEERENCWEKATQNYTNEEIAELHSWMRRD